MHVLWLVVLLTSQPLSGHIIQQYVDWFTGIGCYIWYSEEGTGWGLSPPMLLLALPNVTAYPSAASVPTSYN